MTGQDVALGVAQGWIERYEAIQANGEGSPQAQRSFSAYEAFSTLVGEDPESAWRAVLFVVERTDNEFVLENLAAGPLETLIGRYGDKFVDRIESRAAVDEKFRWLLGGVWEGTMSPAIWERIQRAAGEQE